MPTVSSGDMTRRLRILNPIDAPDSRGSTPKRYQQDGGPIWAKIAPLQASELTVADAIAGTVTHLVTIYHTTRVTARSRFETLDNPARAFEVIGLYNLGERDRYLECRCREAEPAQ